MAEPTSPTALALSRLSKMDRRMYDAHLHAMTSYEYDLEEDGFSAYAVRELVNYLKQTPQQVEQCLYDSLNVATLTKMYEYYISTLHKYSSVHTSVDPSILTLFKVAKAMHNRGLAYQGKLVPQDCIIVD
jgi:hypothetical protein